MPKQNDDAKAAQVARPSGETELAERVREVIATSLCVDLAIAKNEASLTADLSADSLDTVELVMAFEEKFDVEISDDEMFKIRTVGDAITLVSKLSQC